MPDPSSTSDFVGPTDELATFEGTRTAATRAPFDAASPSQAPPGIVGLAHARLADTLWEHSVNELVAEWRRAG